MRSSFSRLFGLEKLENGHKKHTFDYRACILERIPDVFSKHDAKLLRGDLQYGSP